jgi:hypothetical protein
MAGRGDSGCVSRGAGGGRRSEVDLVFGGICNCIFKPEIRKSTAALWPSCRVSCCSFAVFFCFQLAHGSVPKLIFASVRSPVSLPKLVRPIQDLLFAGVHEKSFCRAQPRHRGLRRRGRGCADHASTHGPQPQQAILPLVPDQPIYCVAVFKLTSVQRKNAEALVANPERIPWHATSVARIYRSCIV